MLLSQSSLFSVLLSQEGWWWRKKGWPFILDLHLLSGAYVFPILRLEFTALSWRDDLSLGLYGRDAAAVMTSRAPCRKKTSKRGSSCCTLNLIAAWFDIVLPSAVSFYLIELFFKEINRCIHFSLWSHLYLFIGLKERQEETTEMPPVFHMCGPWQQKMDFFMG